MSPLKLTWIVAIFALALDQATKVGVVWGLDLITVRYIEVIPPYLVFVMGWNTGINFGLFGGSGEFGRWFLVVIAVGVSVLLSNWVRKATGWLSPTAFGLIIGGALGNALDRVMYGAVADFLNMSCCGFQNPYTFNVADIFIFAGVFAVIIQSFAEEWEAKKSQ
ncbi:MAG: signal peptidase II [Pseudomonadota bacterium]